LKTSNENFNDLIVKYLSGCATKEESIRLQEWLSESDENKRMFDELSDVWHATSLKSSAKFDLIGGYHNVSKLLWNDSGNDKSANPANKSIKLYRVALQVAAILIVALVIGILVTYQSGKRIQVANSNVQTEISAPLGSKTNIILPDGTKVWLNAGSTIRYNAAFNQTNRQITLVGEAYFDVVKKLKSPFLVITSDVTIKVLGTAFNLKAYPNEGSVETTLVRGSLIVEQNTGGGKTMQTILAPKQRATFVKQTGQMFLSETEAQVMKKEKVQQLEQVKGTVLVAKEIDTEIFTAWKDNKLIFRNESFESLVVKLERWYGVKISIPDEEIKKYHFNGTIENETINEVMDIVCYTLPVSYSILHNNITITKSK
jgi:ferric-dicitrate binding protein FerR (iron transport regulator)